MCGIAGIIKRNKSVERQEIETITHALQHRGPDGEGVFLHNNLAIGHRRLSIIDLQAGAQPMCSADKSIYITFNGEIYNYRELRSDLIQRGHTFTTHSDTEVIIYAYKQWGTNCVKHLRGMFAFAIVDFERQQVFLSRDIFGIKPLVFYHDSSSFVFASELQALKTQKYIDLDINISAIDDYLRFLYIPAPNTIYAKVQKLQPAHYMVIDFEANIVAHERYWRLDFKTKRNLKTEDWINELDVVIRQSVRSQLVSDVPFGAFLSGGIDSSLVVGYMAEIMNTKVKTFTIGFDSIAENEINYARQVADKWQTDHTEEILTANAIELLPQLVAHYGEPYADSSAIPTYYVSKFARQHVKMVLSGDGGDELFAGYHLHTYWKQYTETYNFRLPKWKEVLYPWAQKIFPNRYSVDLRPKSTVENWQHVVEYNKHQNRKQLWLSQFSHLADAPTTIYTHEGSTAQQLSTINMAQYMDIKTYLPYDILTKVDIASMMNGLEVRPPLLSQEVAEFAATIPEKMNVQQIDANQWEGKMLLKKLLLRNFSSDFVFRTKQGFSIPDHKWFYDNTTNYNQIMDRLYYSKSPLHNIFDKEEINRVIQTKRKSAVWSFLVLDEWFRQNNVTL